MLVICNSKKGIDGKNKKEYYAFYLAISKLKIYKTLGSDPSSSGEKRCESATVPQL